jgi:hypothetical protein
LPELQEWFFRGTPVERVPCFANGSEEKRFAYKTACKTDKVKVAEAATRSRKLSASCSTIQHQRLKKTVTNSLPSARAHPRRWQAKRVFSIAR